MEQIKQRIATLGLVTALMFFGATRVSYAQSPALVLAPVLCLGGEKDPAGGQRNWIGISI